MASQLVGKRADQVCFHCHHNAKQILIHPLSGCNGMTTYTHQTSCAHIYFCTCSMPNSDVTVNGLIYTGNKSAPFHAYETKHDMFPLRVMKLYNCLF